MTTQNTMNQRKEDEIILVVRNAPLFNYGALRFQGATKDTEIVESIMENIDFNYISSRRGSTEEEEGIQNAELNFDYKQPIPYMVVKRGDQYFVTERLSGGGESRLHGKLSMGLGGHMNPVYYEGEPDVFEPFKDVLYENTMRELEEEVEIVGNEDVSFKIIGLINDDSNDVGKVHIGILGFIELDKSADVAVREVEQLAGHWYTIEELRSKEVYDRLENWGKIVVDLI